ncbi:hypothetical protein C7S14_1151 [Burkholderia cepacia]|nr:hypothetical protein C7S14_1151 [Burkholderia cepacia]
MEAGGFFSRASWGGTSADKLYDNPNPHRAKASRAVFDET